jgi:hypothetical protein
LGRLTPFRALLLLLVPAFLLYAKTLGSGFFADDFLAVRWLSEAPPLDRLARAFTANWFEFRGYPYYRPVTTASLLADHALFGLQASGYHLQNLLLHVLNGALVLAVLRRLGAGAGVAVWGALLFVLHPATPNAVAWPAARSDVLAGFFTLLGFLAHLARRPVLLGVAFLLGLGAKESAAVLPLLVLGHHAILGKRGGGWRGAARAVLPLAAPAAVWLIARFTFVSTPYPLHAAPAAPAALARSLLGQAARAAAPIEPAATWGTLLLLLLLLPVALRPRATLRPTLFALLWVLGNLLPVLPIAGDLAPELFAGYARYWYLPAAALAAGAALVPRFLLPPAAALVLTVFLALGFARTSLRRANEHAWSGEVTRRFAEQVAAVCPDDGAVPVFLVTPGHAYSGAHLIPLALSAAARRPFLRRDVPLVPLPPDRAMELVGATTDATAFRALVWEESERRLRTREFPRVAPSAEAPSWSQAGDFAAWWADPAVRFQPGSPETRIEFPATGGAVHAPPLRLPSAGIEAVAVTLRPSQLGDLPLLEIGWGPGRRRFEIAGTSEPVEYLVPVRREPTWLGTPTIEALTLSLTRGGPVTILLRSVRLVPRLPDVAVLEPGPGEKLDPLLPDARVLLQGPVPGDRLRVHFYAALGEDAFEAPAQTSLALPPSARKFLAASRNFGTGEAFLRVDALRHQGAPATVCARSGLVRFWIR